MVTSLSSITLLMLALRIGLWCVCSHWHCHSGECVSTAPYRWLWSSAWVFVDWRKLHFESANIAGLAINISLKRLLFTAVCVCFVLAVVQVCCRRCTDIRSLTQGCLSPSVKLILGCMYSRQNVCLNVTVVCLSGPLLTYRATCCLIRV